MKISNIGSFTSYHTNTSKIKKTEISKPKNFDSIQINKNTNDITQSNISLDIYKIKDKILSEVNLDANADRIKQIKEKTENKTYDINTTELAKILLNI
ncbi:flagellar biosynthesis anti-sigma factor FlgM [Sedimentibacter sp. zth1]|uniref:flagellar biosynthesis anti-sigma factor FlgM n=1 Tax=Sedimentibacter sp. zth1 TaxID=2816908 RepID=UPI001A915848|nr:flagellar biosynthesis anti-sigma factor FlgM [Sedimentibacter sp. zth1]QSX06023.1 flagellar biosynthesis anti-sigma factor FlgM [Sedimentibacter sp. zth1]